jgi:serine protease
MPSNCPGVISVGATTSAGSRASYSNFGATMTISAPGGDTFARSDGIEILSNLGLSIPTTDALDVGNGTSYAAPMVSGVAR